MQAARIQWQQVQKQIEAEHFVCIDESNAKTNMTRLYGRAKREGRCFCKAPHGHWKTITMLSAIWSDVKTETIAYDGGTDKKIFELFIEKYLLPKLKAGDILVLDNLRAHKSEKVVRLVASKGAKVMYLPPYSPDLNPIEQMWSKVKSVLKNIEARTVDALYDAIATAHESITKKDAIGWFTKSGYKH